MVFTSKSPSSHSEIQNRNHILPLDSGLPNISGHTIFCPVRIRLRSVHTTLSLLKLSADLSRFLRAYITL
nr:MAG TPA: hypothetical protein [Caudoviricetes sp.]DAZ58240.1 MAG TPA: hypothetical protein [Caudoviricetes sp.]